MILSFLTSVLDISYETLMKITVIVFVLISYLVYKYGLFELDKKGTLLLGLFFLDLVYNLYSKYYEANNKSSQQQQLFQQQQQQQFQQQLQQQQLQKHKSTIAQVAPIAPIAQVAPVAPIAQVAPVAQVAPIEEDTQWTPVKKSNNDQQEYRCDGDVCYRVKPELSMRNVAVSPQTREELGNSGRNGINIMNDEFSLNNSLTEENEGINEREEEGRNEREEEGRNEREKGRQGMGIKIVESDDDGYYNILSNLSIDVREI
jgi:hypothetical protein